MQDSIVESEKSFEKTKNAEDLVNNYAVPKDGSIGSDMSLKQLNIGTDKGSAVLTEIESDDYKYTWTENNLAEKNVGEKSSKSETVVNFHQNSSSMSKVSKTNASEIVQQNNLATTENTVMAKTNLPLEMNITTENFTLTTNSIDQMSLPSGRPTPVVVSETRSPWNFYVQVVNNNLEKLMQELRYSIFLFFYYKK